MLYTDFTTKLLGIKDVIVKKVEENEKSIEIHIEMPLKEQICPCCGCKTTSVHDYRIQKIKDIPSFGNASLLVVRKRRYKCKHCGKQFLEQLPFAPRYYRMTDRMIASIINELREVCSFTSVAKRYRLSVPTVIRIFDVVNYPKPELPQVLAIDEFKGNANGEKYLAIITDPKSKIVLDILPKRYENYLISYFKPLNRQDVKYFVSDMWKPYYHLSQSFFSNARYITDRYHFVRQLVWAFENVRKEEQKRLSKTYRQSFKRSKSILLKRIKTLSDEDRQAVGVILKISPKLSMAHYLKELFFELLQEQDPKTAKKLLAEWIMTAQEYDLPQFISCTKTFATWSLGICNSYEYRYSNGFTEGCNNKIKVLKRNAYGYRNFKRFRNRILHIFNDKNTANQALKTAVA